MSNTDDDPYKPSDIDISLPAAAAALSVEDRTDLVNALKNKLQSLAGAHADIFETLSPEVKKRVEFLRKIQSEHDKLEGEYFEERKALEAKYQKLYEPLYMQRYEIVNGVKEVEAAKNESLMGPEDKEEKGVPNFWLTALKTNGVLADEITERDEEALKFLKDIKWHRVSDPEGFKLAFYFDSNPYFKNSLLTKTFCVIDNDDDPILDKTIGTEIEWFPGKCLTKKVLKKKPKKGSKNSKPITKVEDCPSFFTFFNSPQVPEDDDELDDNTVEEIEDCMEKDYNIGTTLRDKIIPHAVSWFTGEAVQDEELDSRDDEDEEDGTGDEDDEDDEDETLEDCKNSGKKVQSSMQI
ncbi:hypothetical protein K2173_009314 [Erythroxylum novogranatense]|uniref:Nucleosome assembly protein n=1 Tax=Erythroxylum novogranatense TaxID=1862640 RepID=A0AAV8U7S0_9ROSI|nr:hypothetical protein K2173_009314 [Erythroxylum novogranatense]